jgi:hypothetical protein
MTRTLAALLLVGSLTACGRTAGAGSSSTIPSPKDATRGGWDLIPVPEGWYQIATKCDHGNRLYAANGVAVVPADPTCKEGAR